MKTTQAALISIFYFVGSAGGLGAATGHGFSPTRIIGTSSGEPELAGNFETDPSSINPADSRAAARISPSFEYPSGLWNANLSHSFTPVNRRLDDILNRFTLISACSNPTRSNAANLAASGSASCTKVTARTFPFRLLNISNCSGVGVRGANCFWSARFSFLNTSVSWPRRAISVTRALSTVSRQPSASQPSANSNATPKATRKAAARLKTVIQPSQYRAFVTAGLSTESPYRLLVMALAAVWVFLRLSKRRKK